MSRSPRLRRSLLFVPGAEERKLVRARDSAADTLILDLEDSIAPDRKAEARARVAAALREAEAGIEMAVRINPPGTPWHQADLEAVLEGGARSLMLPKAEAGEGVRALAARIEALEQRGGTAASDGVRLLALVESPAGILAATEVGRASARVEALCFGHADFSTAMGLADADASRGTVLHARCALAIAAKATGVVPIDTVFVDVRDNAGFRADAAQGRDLGFEGKLCIHPAQVEIANEVYTPSAEEIARARIIVEGWQQAVRDGQGVFTVENKMVDAPLVAVQERLLERARLAGVL
jgi:citrate lyase subunit beta/citryl-CoA lyase